MRLGSALALTAASGALYGSAFPGLPFLPDGWWPLAWIALVPFLVAVAAGGAARALGLGVWLGITSSYGVGTWMPAAVVSYYEQPLVLGLAIFLVCALWQAAWQFALFAWLWRRLARAPRAWTPLAAGAAWVGAEVARTQVPFGNPWALLGYSQTAAPLLAQTADVTGIFGPSCVLVGVNAALALAWRHGLAASRGALGVAAALVAIVVAYGAVRLAAEDAGAARAATPIVAVQGNLDLGTQWKSEFYGANLAAYAQHTTTALAARPASVVVWPESALTFFLERDASYRAYLAQLLSSVRTTLLTGGPRVVADGGRETYRNAAFVVAPTGTIEAVYEKETLVPFAEYFPLGDGLLRRQFGKVREFTPGHLQDPLPTPAGAAGVLICNEAMVGTTAGARVRAGATWLVTLTNDSWVGRRHYAEIALAMARARAIETRRWLVRASTSGPSVIVDPAGRIVDRLPFGSAGAVAASIDGRTDLTPYARVGDVFAWACVVATALLAALYREPS